MQVSFRFMQIVHRGLLRSQRTVLQVDRDGQFHVVREVADGSLSGGRRLLLPFLAADFEFAQVSRSGEGKCRWIPSSATWGAFGRRPEDTDSPLRSLQRSHALRPGWADADASSEANDKSTSTRLARLRVAMAGLLESSAPPSAAAASILSERGGGMSRAMELIPFLAHARAR
jgi:hypothetical protein